MCLSVATRRQDLAVALGSTACELEKVAGGALSRSQGWGTTLPQLCVEPQADRRWKPRAWLWPPRVHLPTKNPHGARPFQSSEVVWFCCEVFRWLKLSTAPAALAQDPHPTPLASSDTADVHPEFSSMPGIPYSCFQSPFPQLSPSHTHLNCHPDSAVGLPAELFLSAGQHLTTSVHSCGPDVMHKGLTVVEWHLIAVLEGAIPSNS